MKIEYNSYDFIKKIAAERRNFQHRRAKGKRHEIRRCRIAQRGQVHTIQCNNPCRRRGRQLPLLHHRAQRGRCSRSRRAAGQARRAIQQQKSYARRGGIRGHSGACEGRFAGRGTGQQVPFAHTRMRRDSTRGALLRRPQRNARFKQNRPHIRHSDDNSRAHPRRHRGSEQARRQDTQHRQGRQQGGRGGIRLP